MKDITTSIFSILIIATTTKASLTYEVSLSITNNAPSGGTCQTRVWIGFHDGTFDIYNLNEPASDALERIAEDGNAESIISTFHQSQGTFIDAVVGKTPICPGDRVDQSFLITVPDGDSMYVSYTSMVLPSNDAFIANEDPKAYKVSDEFGNIVFEPFTVPGSEVLDAGTEVNDEGEETTAFLGQSMPDTGLKEGNNIMFHQGFLEDGPILDHFPSADFTANDYETIRLRIRATLVTQRVELTFAASNLAPQDGTCQTPLWIAVHDGSFDIYDRGEAASSALERLAEDGNASPLSDDFIASPGSLVDKIVGKAPICPGQSASARIRFDVPIGRPLYMSYASMILPSNDAFIANGDPLEHPLFSSDGKFTFQEFVVDGAEVLDAGTEVNDEADTTTAFLGQSMPNSGENEDGVVTSHNGFLKDGRIFENFPRSDFTAQGYEMLQISASVLFVTRPHMVTIMATNNAPAGGTCQTPVWVGIHNGMFDIYNRGQPASLALERIAEDGAPASISEAFGETMGSIVDGVIGSSPICPGERAKLTLTVNVPFGMSLFFSYASMVLPSNDAFIANGDPMTHRLFDARANFHFEDFIVSGSEILDAGTEINDESETTTAFLGQQEANSGSDENGVIEIHPGFLADGPIIASFPAADFAADGYETISFSAMASEVSQAQLSAVTVTIKNNAPFDGTCQTPVWVGFHSGMFDVYNRGEAASVALERIAEDGNAAPLSESFTLSMGTIVDGVVGSEPFCPDETVSATFLVSRQPGLGVYFSYASMLLPSNDAFIANGNPMRHNVFSTDGSFDFETFTVMGSEVLDAGTEVNDEAQDTTAFLGQSEGNTGEDENAVITKHAGFNKSGLIVMAFPASDFKADGYETIVVSQTAVSVPSFVRTNLRPRFVVPRVGGNNRANMKFRIYSNGDINFRIKFRSVEGVKNAGLFMGSPGKNGSEITSLFKSEDLLGKSSGRFAVRGSIIQGSVERMTNELLWNQIVDGNLYVQVSTTTFPDGAIRGDLSF